MQNRHIIEFWYHNNLGIDKLLMIIVQHQHQPVVNYHLMQIKHVIIILAIGINACFLASCTDGLARIDRNAQKIIAEHASLIGSDTKPDPDNADSADQINTLHSIDSRSQSTYEQDESGDVALENSLSRKPVTINPAASELEFSTLENISDYKQISEILERYTKIPEDARRYDLNETLLLALTSAPEYLTAKEELFFAALRLLSERHNFGPRFFNDTTVSFNSDVEEGDWNTAVSALNQFRMTRKLETGGELGVQALVRATEQLRSSISTDGSQSAEIVLSADLPLLRGAGLIASESLISAEREMIYATRTFERFRRQFLFDIATNYYDIIRSAVQIKNAEGVLVSRMKLFDETEALYKAGRKPEFETNEAKQRVLSSQNSLASQKDRFILQIERFRVRLGLPPDSLYLVNTESANDLSIPDLDSIESIRRGLLYRLDIQNDRDQVDDTRRAVKNSRNSLKPELNLNASMTLITDPDKKRSGLGFEPDNTEFAGSVSLGMPLDRELERIALRRAQITYERAVRNFRQTEDDAALSIRSAIRNIYLALFSLRLQQESVAIVERRIEGLKVRKKRGNVDSRTEIDAQDELESAQQQLASARRDLRVAIMEYLLETGQFRVGVFGQLILPDGMTYINIEEYMGKNPVLNEPDISENSTLQNIP